MSARGPRSTVIRGWSWSASTRPSSRSRKTSRTSACRRATWSVGLPDRARPATTRSGSAFANMYWPAALHRRRGRPDPTPPVRRGWIRRLRKGHPAAAGRVRARRAPATIWSPSLRTVSRRRPTGSTWDLPRHTSAIAQGQNFASPGGAELDRAPRVRRAGVVEAQPVGARRGVDGRTRRKRAQRNRRSASRFASTPATSISSCDHARWGHRCRSACSSTEPLREPTTGSTSTKTATGRWFEPRLYQLVRRRGSIADRTFEITFLAPGAEAYVFTFG